MTRVSSVNTFLGCAVLSSDDSAQSVVGKRSYACKATSGISYYLVTDM